jgi:FdhD protein
MAGWSGGERAIPEETAIAFAYGGCAYAVMMATPDDLTDFAIGFSLTEGIVAGGDDIENIDIVASENGIAINMTLAAPRMDAFWERRRFLAGPSGCGLCGIESLEQALRRCRPVATDLRVSAPEIDAAIQSLRPRQVLNQRTHAVHAAGFWQSGRGLLFLREDIGRHNAVDKLAGAVVKARAAAAQGVLVLTSRVSVELIQKASFLGVPIIAAVSAPTALAMRIADAAGMTLIAIARDDGFEIFTHAERIIAQGCETAA